MQLEDQFMTLQYTSVNALERGLIIIARHPGPTAIRIENGQFVLIWQRNRNETTDETSLRTHRQKIPIDSTERQVQSIVDLGNRIISIYRRPR